MLFYGLLLVLVFRVYLSQWGLGESHLEQMAYFLGCVPGMVLFMRGIVGRIETLFKTDGKQ